MALRQLKNRIIRQRAQKEAAYRKETRDAILWDILDDKRCRVKVLGSNTLLVANYPENLEHKPVWLKPGNAVKILHTAGNRHMLEVIGSGQAIPTPTSGSMLPVPAVNPDAVLTGCQLLPFESDEMKVGISVGTFRIGGVLYSLETMTLADTNLNTFGSGLELETTAGVVAISAAHATLYRIDIVVMGIDKVLDVVAGTAASTPTQPSTPADHVLVGRILIPPAITAIKTEHINRDFVAPMASQLASSITDTDLAWAETYTDITISVKDQYGRNLTGTNWGITAAVTSGTGTVDAATKYTGTSGNSVTFRYSRNYGVTEHSPFLTFGLTQNPSMVAVCVITLRDIDGNILV